MSKWVKIILIGLLFLMLIGVRYFASRMLYDPFIEYFKQDYLSKPMPQYDGIKLFTNLLIRYSINTIISIAILWVAFEKMRYIRFSVKFYLIAFVFLSFAYFAILNSEFIYGYRLAYYIRRFIIHPLFILLLLPAFYFFDRHPDEA